MCNVDLIFLFTFCLLIHLFVCLFVVCPFNSVHKIFIRGTAKIFQNKRLIAKNYTSQHRYILRYYYCYHQQQHIKQEWSNFTAWICREIAMSRFPQGLKYKGELTGDLPVERVDRKWSVKISLSNFNNSPREG